MVKIGIDLGTTNTVVAMVYDDGPHVLPRGRGRIIPSVVKFQWEKGDQDVLAGEDADRDEAGERVVRSIKRLMGRTYEEARSQGSEKYFPPDSKSVRLVSPGEKDLGLAIGRSGKFLWPYEISAHILRTAKKHAEEVLRMPVTSAGITVPAYFRDPHRKATLDAASLAGLDVIGELIDEPTAAALAFSDAVGFEVGEQILVLDWGGGTYDVTVLYSDGEKWFQAAIDGDLALGGDDLDHALAKMILRDAGINENILADEINAFSLLRSARLAKESLSEFETVPFVCPPLTDPSTGRKLKPITKRISRSDFESAIQEYIKKVAEITERCLKNPDVDRASIRHVLLVGGSTGIPAFQKEVTRLLPRARLHDEVNSLQAVALGAAIYAHSRPEIARICPYGYEAVNVNKDEGEEDIYINILPPNTEVPTPDSLRSTLTATTIYDGQTVYRLSFRSYTEHGNKREYHDTQRLFARNMPRTPTGTSFPIKVWLDENKTIQAECHILGESNPKRMEGREEGPEELFTRLLSISLDAEAMAEANVDSSEGLMADMKKTLVEADEALKSKDRILTEKVLVNFSDIFEMIKDRQGLAIEEMFLPKEKQIRNRIQAWISFYEGRILSDLKEGISSDQIEEIESSLHDLKSLINQGASGDALEEKHAELRNIIKSGDFGVVLEGVLNGVLRGVPKKLKELLDESVQRALNARRRRDRKAFREESEKLRELNDQADEAWSIYYDTGLLKEVGPDLEIKKGSTGRGSKK